MGVVFDTPRHAKITAKRFYQAKYLLHLQRSFDAESRSNSKITRIKRLDTTSRQKRGFLRKE